MPDRRHRLIGRRHRVIQTRADQLQLAGTAQVFILEIRAQLPADAAVGTQPLQLVHHQLVTRFFLAALHPAKADVAQVLDPLKVRHRHTARIGIHVGNDHHTLPAQHLIGTGRDGTIGRLDNQGGLDAVRIAQVDHPLKGGRDQDVAIRFQQPSPFLLQLCIRIARDRVMLGDPLINRLNVQPVFIMQGTVTFNDPGDQTTVFLAQELGRVIAHVAQALNDHALAFQGAGQSGLGQSLRVAKESMQRILHTAPRGLGAALNAACIGGFAGDTGHAVDVGRVHPFVLIGDPGHLALACAHVGGWHVLRGVDHVALDQLIGKAAGDQLQFMFVIFARINT